MLLRAYEITLNPHALDMLCKYSIIIKRLFGATSLACLDKFWIFPQIPGRLKIFTTLTNSIKGIYFAVTSFHGRITSQDWPAPDRRNSSKFLIFFFRNPLWLQHRFFKLLVLIQTPKTLKFSLNGAIPQKEMQKNQKVVPPPPCLSKFVTPPCIERMASLILFNHKWL